jgi:hypothetical protein
VFGVEYAPYLIKLIADTLTEIIVPSGVRKEKMRELTLELNKM